MCPNCIRGLTIDQKEVCPTCSGTGFWNPLSAKTSDMEEKITITEDVVIEPVVAEPPVDAPVEKPVADAPVADASDVAPEVTESTPVAEAPVAEVTNLVQTEN